MKPYRVAIKAQAKQQLHEALAWMMENFITGREIFRHELDSALHRLALLPFSGSLFLTADVPNMRRLLRRSQYHIYYEVDDAESLINVHAIWSTARGSLPELPQ